MLAAQHPSCRIQPWLRLSSHDGRLADHIFMVEVMVVMDKRRQHPEITQDIALLTTLLIAPEQAYSITVVPKLKQHHLPRHGQIEHQTIGQLFQYEPSHVATQKLRLSN